jgi:hypothetical protein
LRNTLFLAHVVICVAMAQQMANMLPAGMVQQMGGKPLAHTINNTSTNTSATIGMGNIMEMVKQFGGAGGPGGGGMAELMQQAAAMAGGGGRGGGGAAARGGGRGRRRR